MYTAKQRIAIYNRAIKYIEKESYANGEGVCLALIHANWDKYEDLPGAYPEVWLFKPRRNEFGPYWLPFTKKDKQTRIIILEFAIQIAYAE